MVESGILIQARMGSSRLPGKTMMSIGNKRIVDWVHYRCSKSTVPEDKIIFCISNAISDEPLNDYLLSKGYNVYRGDEQDLVHRFHGACKKYGLKRFIRVTADNPLVGFDVIDYFIRLDSQWKFIDGYNLKKLPNGTIVSRIDESILSILIAHESDKSHREHVVTSPRVNEYRCIPEIQEDWKAPELRFCLDYIEDFNTLKDLYNLDPLIFEKDTSSIINLMESIDKLPNDIYKVY